MAPTHGLNRPRPTVVDLFCGAGGMSLGAARAGFNVVGASDIDKEALQTHAKNFPKTNLLERDIASLTVEELKVKWGVQTGELDGVIGGPPCQGFSCIGKKHKNDPRNGLFVDFFRLVRDLCPKFFLAENVPGILSSSSKKTLEKALSQISGDYILLPPMTLCASEYGAPTTRTRIFFFGFRPEELEALSVRNFMPPASVEQVHVKDALRGLPKKISPSWQSEEQGWKAVGNYGRGYYAARLHGRVPAGTGDRAAINRLKKEKLVSGCLGTLHSQEVVERYATIGPGRRDRVSKSHRLDPNGYCPTLRAGTGADRGRFQAVRPLHPTEDRVITPREAARLQGFPDWFQFSPTKWHSFRQIGSSVSPILAERLMTVVRKALGKPM